MFWHIYGYRKICNGANIMINPLLSTIGVIHHTGSEHLMSFGFPLSKGTLTDVQTLSLRQHGIELDTNLTAVAYWHDKSIRWIQCQAIVCQSGAIELCNRTRLLCARVPSLVNKVDDTSKPTELFSHPKHDLSITVDLQLKGITTPLKFVLHRHDISSNPLTQQYISDGHFEFADQQLNIQLSVIVCDYTDEISIILRAHNPNVAAHQGGKWDLGDPNSLYINDLSIVFSANHTQASVDVMDEYVPTTQHNNHCHAQGEFKLTQFGSGGRHWQSPIHWDQNRRSSVTKRGFELCVGNDRFFQGMRAQPQLTLCSIPQANIHNNKNISFTLEMEDFWQNFPTSLSGHNDGCRWQLFAQNTELQGGESKTWRFNGRFKCNFKANLKAKEPAPKNVVLATSTLTYNADYLSQCHVIPWVSLASPPSSIASIIERGLNDDDNFFNKRERKDVFGWRHYGEIDADHEAVNADVPDEFISHYNNQYDPLLGMTLQFLQGGDLRWLALIRPLQQHIQDIDIYDTDKDKAEYNGGLMWHTDHYLSAQTCTHRSNSKYHEHAYDGFLGGGGPGGQHCYTSGLTLQYWLFGDPSAKQSVAQLCAWIRNFYNGSGSLLERTFRLLTIDIKSNQLTNIGFKAPCYKYPLDRGTANFIIALIDNYDLTAEPALVLEMATIIRHTFHPNEDIGLRDLKNVEQSWFYTIFLQAVVRYLLLKESLEEIDSDYWYARDGLIHFGRWMLNNESYYLDKPQQLEFPNDTWCAQEIRKANIYYYCYYFCSDHNPQYLHQAKAYYEYITQRLSTSSEAIYTRVLAILMQNDGVEQVFRSHPPQSAVPYQRIEHGAPPKLTLTTTIKHFLFDLFRLSANFSLTREYRWLAIRLKMLMNT